VTLSTTSDLERYRVLLAPLDVSRFEVQAPDDLMIPLARVLIDVSSNNQR
jgi:hypothetical protein